jgi:outer membrane protein TolC
MASSLTLAGALLLSPAAGAQEAPTPAAESLEAGELPPSPPQLQLPERGEPEILTLGAALSEAARNNLGIVTSGLDLDDARTAVWTAWAPFTPQLDITYAPSRDRRGSLFIGGTDRFSDSRSGAWSGRLSSFFWTGTSLSLGYTSVGNRTVEQYTLDLFGVEQEVSSDERTVFNRWDLALSQNLLKGFGPWRSRSGLDQARAALTASESQDRARREEVLAQSLNAWSLLRAAHLAVTIAEDDVALARGQREEVLEHIEAGLLAPSEIYAVDEAIASAQAGLLTAHRNRVDAEAALRRLLGRERSSGANPPLRGDGDLPLLPERELAQSQVIALDANPGLATLRAELRSRNVALRASTQALLPTLDLSASLSVNGFAPTFSEAEKELGSFGNTGYDISLNFSMPLLSMAERAERRQAQNAVERSLRTLSDNEHQVLDQVEVAVLEIRNRRVDREVAQRRRDNAERNLEATELRFEAGRADLRDVLQARQGLAQARLAALRSESELLASQVQLELLRGTLSETLGLRFEERPGG